MSHRGRIREEVAFFFQAEDGIRDLTVTGVQTCALPILARATTSLPVPDSPWTSTVAELPATRASSLYTSSMAGPWPTQTDGPPAGGSPRGSGPAAPPPTGRDPSNSPTTPSRAQRRGRTTTQHP